MTRLSEFRQLIDRLDEATTAANEHERAAAVHSQKALGYAVEAGTIAGRLSREFGFNANVIGPEFPSEVVNAPRF